ncbi:MAG TPA: class E sortase [Solirubrobacteraceae bacterium]|jgi:sortase A|nr:class E sortase [Solirubrobacteraceae bacterium]
MADATITSGSSAKPEPRTPHPPKRDRNGTDGTRKGAASRLSRWLAILLIAAGALTLVDAAVTLLWQEPISALLASLKQDHLKRELRTVELARPTPLERRTLASIGSEHRRIAYLAHELERRTANGAPVGRIVIPLIGASYVVVNGTDTKDLESGPGVIRSTTFPGITGTTAIAGHRTTYLAPFRNIDSLHTGNHIKLYMPYAHFTYTVVGHRVVDPHDVAAAVDKVGYTRLVLSACTPLFSAEKRLLVFAHLTKTVPVGAARRVRGGGVVHPIEARAQPRRKRRLPPVLESFDPDRVASVS